VVSGLASPVILPFLDYQRSSFIIIALIAYAVKLVFTSSLRRDAYGRSAPVVRRFGE